MTPEALGTTPANAHEVPWIPDDSTFGARLALIRQQMGWGNVKEAALACDIPVQSWRTWERDNGTPRNIIQIAQRISERTGCDYGWLLAGQLLAGRNQQTSSRKFAPDVSMAPRMIPPTRIYDQVIDTQLVHRNAA